MDYQKIRGALRRSFSGEKVREVEAEYFQFGREMDVERCAQGIVIDLATIVGTKRDTIRQTFGNAMRLVRGISRDEEDTTDPKLSLPEFYKVLQMLKFSASGGHDGALFKMVMKLLDRSVKRDFQSSATRALLARTDVLDRDGDGRLSYEEFDEKVSETRGFVERNMGKLSYLEGAPRDRFRWLCTAQAFAAHSARAAASLGQAAPQQKIPVL